VLDDRVLVHASAVEVGGELVLVLVDDRGNQCETVTTNAPGVADRLGERLVRQLDRPLLSENQRWADRPANGGLDWIAFSAVETGLAALSAEAAGIPLSSWLGGSLRSMDSIVDPDTLGVDGHAVGDASFDEVAAWLPEASVAWLRVDPRIWSVPALRRLDAMCRILQIGMAIELPPGSAAMPIGVALQEALPMATLGRGMEIQRTPAESQRPVFSIGRAPA